VTSPRSRRRQRATTTLLLGTVLAGALAVAALAPGAADTGRPAASQAPKSRAASGSGVVLSATGDLTIGLQGVQPPGGAASLLGDVASSLRADIALGNLETVLGGRGSGKCGAGSSNCYTFTGVTDDAVAIRRAGFTIMNVANNHANDFGTEGRRSTSAALASAGLRWTGKPGQITVVRKRGVRVAVIGFAPYPWAQDLLDIAGAQEIVRRAAARADVVVVTMHAGAEGIGATRVRPGPETYLGEPRGDSVRFTHAVIDAGADLVVGHGPHVLRGLEWYKQRLIAYSLGNFSGYRTLNTKGERGVSAILRARLTSDGRLAEAALVPIDLSDGEPTPDQSGRALTLLRERSTRDFGRRAAAIGADGSIQSPS
jgi:poly-gamma-glutamate capsule biosynthesis protein CapA/YwtB (metallophosphatase superfamily)